MKITTVINLAIALILLTITGCEGYLNERIKKATGTIHKAKSTANEISKTTRTLSKTVDTYTDTTIYKKDSSGRWQKK